MFMFVLNILRHNLLGSNKPEGWVLADRKWVRAWIRMSLDTNEPGYERSMGTKRLVSFQNRRFFPRER